MRSIVATFADMRQAQTLLARLRGAPGLRADMISIGTVAAFGEPHDGHRLVAAWVPDDREKEAKRWTSELGGTLHPQPSSMPPESQAHAHALPAPLPGHAEVE